MTLFRRSRLIFLIARQLAQKYTKALALGFVSGLVISIGFWRVLPFIKEQWFTPVERIGIVGEFTPASLPPSVQKYISMGLTDVAADGTVLPGLATSWTATDSGKTFIFTLRPDILWHNGKHVAAADINYNVRNVSFSAIDQGTLRANLLAPYSPFPAVVAKPLFLNGLVGLGPYRVSQVKLNGDKVTYIKLIPILTTSLHVREYRFYKTESAVILAYKLGEVDEIEDITTPADLAHWGKTKVTEQTKYSRIISLYFNLSISPLSDKTFRQALAYATPVRNGVERAYSPISKTSWAYYDKVKKYALDMTQAKKLIGTTKEASDAGHLTISTFAPYLDDAQAIANSWNTLGISTDVKVESSVPPNYQVLLSAQDLPPDPDQYPFWHSTQKETNITNYANVKIDKLLEDGRQELDMQKRKAIYADFQRRLVEDIPAVFLYYANSYTIHRH